MTRRSPPSALPCIALGTQRPIPAGDWEFMAPKPSAQRPMGGGLIGPSVKTGARPAPDLRYPHRMGASRFS